MDDRQAAHLAANEDLFRQINESIEDVASEHGRDDHHYEFFCECSDPGCSERVSATLEEYRRVREDSRRFIVAKGHVVKEIERVVESANDHAVIEKEGEAGRVAIELDNEADPDR
jgi:hypothetical protein